MATKIEQADNNDLEVLHPEQVLTLKGNQVTVREFGFVESLRLRSLMQPFIEDLYELAAAGGDMPLDEIFDIIAKHEDAVLQMVAVSADIDRDLVDTLSSAEGELLLMAWWGANGPFFSRQLQTRLLSKKVTARTRKNEDSSGQISMENSSLQDTIPDESETTLNDS